MARLPQPGSDNGTWGTILNDFLSQSLNSDGTLKDTGVLASKYVKPGSGIPRSDLTADVQTSLTKADNSPTLLAQLNDVNTSGVTDTQVLSFNAGSSKWVASTVTNTPINDATTGNKGIVQLAGDLGGTATVPTVPGLSNKQPINTDLTTISGLAPSNNDVLQRKSGAWTNRTPSQLKLDLGLTSSDVGLGSVTNDAQLKVASNLSDLNNAAAARTNLGLGSAATQNTAAFDASGSAATAQAASLQKSSNLSDLSNAGTARTNLGLGTAATVSATMGGDLTGTLPNPTLSGTANVESIIRAQSLDQLAGAASAVNMNNQRLISLGNGILSTDAVAIGQLPAAWMQMISVVWTRVSNTQFTISSSTDYTSTFTKGTCIKWTESSVTKYGVVATSSFGSNTTTVNLMPTTDYVMATNPDFLSGCTSTGRPVGFPTAFAWAAPVSGFSSNPVQAGCSWLVADGVCVLQFFCLANGTSNATTFTVTAPIACGNGAVGVGSGTNNGTATMITIILGAGSTSIGLTPFGAANWTGSGSKGAQFSLTYNI